MGESRGAYRVLVRKSEGRSLGRPTRKWEDNIEMDFERLDGGHRLD